MDWRRANKKQLLEKLLPTLEENERLRESVTRLMNSRQAPTIIHHISHPDDFVPAGWPERYGITIPRADGYFESERAWLCVTHGVIASAGLKNQSLIAMVVAAGKLPERAEKHANVYMDWRAAFFARIEAARYSNEGTGDPEAWSKEDRFSKLLHLVARLHLRRVDAMVTARPKEKDIAAFNKRPDEFLESFKITVQAISKINRNADQYLAALKDRAHLTAAASVHTSTEAVP